HLYAGTTEYWKGAALKWQIGESGSWLSAGYGAGSWEYTDAYLPDAWTTGHKYQVQCKAKDNALNEETPGEGNLFVFDKEKPISGVTLPEEGKRYSSITTLLGTADDPTTGEFVSGVGQVEVRIYDTVDAKYWNGSNAFDLDYATAAWISSDITIYTSSWTYTKAVDWTSDHKYLINSRAKDSVPIHLPSKPNVEIAIATTTFYFDDAAPDSLVNEPIDGDSYSSLSTISGTATDDLSGGPEYSGVDDVEIKIYDKDTTNYLLIAIPLQYYSILSHPHSGTCMAMVLLDFAVN
ncbi:unnamed protein product, partial [marine sediment metagenome]